MNRDVKNIDTQSNSDILIVKQRASEDLLMTSIGWVFECIWGIMEGMGCRRVNYQRSSVLQTSKLKRSHSL